MSAGRPIPGLRRLAIEIGELRRQIRSMPRQRFGTVSGVGSDGTISVDVPAVDEDDGSVITATMLNVRVIGLDIPSLGDVVELTDSGNGRIVMHGRVRTDATPVTGLMASSTALADWQLTGAVWKVAARGLFRAPAAGTTSLVIASLETAPTTGNSCIVDVFKNGVSLWAGSPGSRPTILDTTPNAFVAVPVIVPYLQYDAFTASVAQAAGRGLEVQVFGG